MFSSPMKNYEQNLEALRGFVEMVEPVLRENAEHHLQKGFGGIILGTAIFFALLGDEEGDTEKSKIESLRAFVEQAREDGFPIVVEPAVIDGIDGVNITNTTTGEVNFLTKKEARSLARNSVSEYAKASAKAEILYQGALVSLVGYAEWFFASLLTIYFRTYPNLAGATEKCFSLEDLESFADVDDAKEYLIADRITGIMRGSVSDWLGFMKSTAKLSMDGYLTEERDLLIEVFERRNLVTHNNGVVNHLYLKNVAEGAREGCVYGEHLEMDREYIEASIERLERVFLLVAAELWKQLAPDDDHRVLLLNQIAYGHMLDERWSVSLSLSTFAQGDKNADEGARLIGRVNQWLSQKMMGGIDSIRDAVEQCDFSAKGERFKIAKLALLDDFSELAEQIPRAIKREDMSLDEVYEWPLLAGFRACDLFDAVAEQIGAPENDDLEPIEILEAESLDEA